MSTIKPLILLILDGWGHSHKYHGNAIKQAYTPNLDYLWYHCPRTLLHTSGEHVGLPKGQMGNSEVGHTTIGAGRVINQELLRISKAIETGKFFNNQVLKNIYEKTSLANQKIHLIGLCSDGGVHSHIKHLFALIEMSKQYSKLETCIHFISDGRDTKPASAQKFINQLKERIDNISNINICTISGRYYGMDRDCRWNRTEKTYKCLINNQIDQTYFQNIQKLIQDSYKNNIYDEFILPTRIYHGTINNGDSIIFFNFRPDRARQLAQAFCSNSFSSFKTKKIHNLSVATFTTYSSSLNTAIVFPKIIHNNFLGQIISENQLKQLRLAETEKYAHVTYFFNGGREEPFSGENRFLVTSPSVNLYDSTPEMSAWTITNRLIEAINQDVYQLIIVNYANPDMLGHTGNFSATKKSIEIMDQCLAKLLKTTKNKEVSIIITADHGNAEEMLDTYNQTCKSHTNNLVPLIFIPNTKKISVFNKSCSRPEPLGSLADIAPTILHMLNINIPKEMSGQSLIDNMLIHNKCSTKLDLIYSFK